MTGSGVWKNGEKHPSSPVGVRRVSLRLSGEWEAYALDTAGKRLAKHPLTRQADGAIALELDNFRYPEAVFAYELIRIK